MDNKDFAILAAKALGAWEKDVCDLIHGEETPCPGNHYNPAGDDSDFQRLKKAAREAFTKEADEGGKP